MTDAGLPLAALGDIPSSGKAKMEFSSPKATSYLAQLTTLPLDSILAEPDNLLHFLPIHKRTHKSLHFFLPNLFVTPLDDYRSYLNTFHVLQYPRHSPR